MSTNQYCVYILTNKNNTVLYIGVTSDITKRIYQHKNKMIDGFTKKYNVDKLVHFEISNDVNSAIEREKQLKKWRRDKKVALIEEDNPSWTDLSLEWM
ncbi:MAG: GIY-YIG nuclease family protein [Clostridia bacterium]|nr:GIY-YIG nuclease family protein [Clostridia bacterium]